MADDKLVLVGPTLTRPDEPNVNGDIFTREALENALKEAKERIEGRRLVGVIGPEVSLMPGGGIPVTKVSHVVTRLELGCDGMEIEVEVLGTPEGKRLIEMIRGGGLEVSASGRWVGNIEDGKTKGDLKLMSYDLVPGEQGRVLKVKKP